MLCWNCNRPVAKKAMVCAHCEADLSERPSSDELQAALKMLQQMPPGVLAEMEEVVRDSGTAEEFANRILVGPCPRCQSDHTGDCENDPEINELFVGRCYECGQMWCTECGHLLERTAPCCACWEAD